MVVSFWLLFVFVIGTVIGSFLNVAIGRLPLYKSVLWPSSRCGQCYQGIHWYDNIPLFSYLWLRGRCRACGASYSVRYFLIELLTGLGFVGLFYVEVVCNIHQWPDLMHSPVLRGSGFYPSAWWLGFAFHALLFSLLLAASVCDLDGRQIPLSITVPGTLLGLAGAALCPWPWPWLPAEALAPVRAAAQYGGSELPWYALMPPHQPKQGLYPWPVWGPLPTWLEPGTWQMGLATGVAGMLAGTLLLRAIGYLFSTGLGKEALGLGDADLMMMAGAFLGWQPMVVAFFLSVIPALVFGLVQLIVHREAALPFGPSLALGTLLSMLGWRWIAPEVQVLFFWDVLLLTLVVFGAVFMFGSSYLIRLLRSSEPQQGS